MWHERGRSAGTHGAFSPNVTAHVSVFIMVDRRIAAVVTVFSGRTGTMVVYLIFRGLCCVQAVAQSVANKTNPGTLLFCPLWGKKKIILFLRTDPQIWLTINSKVLVIYYSKKVLLFSYQEPQHMTSQAENTRKKKYNQKNVPRWPLSILSADDLTPQIFFFCFCCTLLY